MRFENNGNVEETANEETRQRISKKFPIRDGCLDNVFP